jgi:hypothetical protein
MGVGAERNAPATLPPGKTPGTYFTSTGGLVGLRAGLAEYGKSRLYRHSIPGQYSPYTVAIQWEPGIICPV